SGPYYSPDGRQIVFSRETDKCGHIWIMSSDGTAARQLTFGPDYDSNPIFTPDGGHIWFQRTPLGTSIGHYREFTMTSTGGNVRPLDAADPELGQNASFSPNSDWVYFTKTDYSSSTPYQVWHMHANGSEKQFVVNGDQPNVSPDGSEVAFVAGNHHNELWT